MTELLSPAGSYESLKAAVNAGADAVYIGGQHFSARAFADNPDTDGLLEGIEYCHLRGRKLYLTLNTLLKEEEITEGLVPFLNPLYEHGLDAVLVQDFGVLHFLRENYPDLKLHASTQMSVTTDRGASWLLSHGVSRVVPARELSLGEIRRIVQTGIETETFIHGAMCYCYSGRCLMSSMLGGRSGNRGKCAQPCRLPYTDGQYLLSMKDLCTLDLLPDLMDAGITSFKIEGRMKQPAYTAGVTSVYRKYMDLYEKEGRQGYRVSDQDRQLLLDLFNRSGFSDGYYRKSNGPDMIEIRRESPLRKHSGTSIPEENSKVKINGELRIYLHSPVILDVWTADTKPGEESRVRVTGDVPSKAIHAALTKADVCRQIEKTGDTAFLFSSLKIDIQEGLFLPLASLNDLRRRALYALKDEILKKTNPRLIVAGENKPAFPEETKSFKEQKSPGEQGNPRYTILVTLPDQLSAVLTWLSSSDGSLKRDVLDTVYLDSMLLSSKKDLRASCADLEEAAGQLHASGVSCFFVMPPILREAGKEILERPCVCRLLDRMDGFLIQTPDELAYMKDSRGDAVLASEDCLYSFNRESCSFWEREGITRMTFPAELTFQEMRAVKNRDMELIIYGYQALMQSAQCLKKNTAGCTKTPGISVLTDRKNIRFPVLNRCLFCTNTIYNSVPLNLTGCAGQIQTIAPSYLRLSFTVETRKETEKILHLFAGREPYPLPADGTRGHFKRGVE